MEIESKAWVREPYSVRVCRCGAALPGRSRYGESLECSACGRRTKR